MPILTVLLQAGANGFSAPFIALAVAGVAPPLSRVSAAVFAIVPIALAQCIANGAKSPNSPLVYGLLAALFLQAGMIAGARAMGFRYLTRRQLKREAQSTGRKQPLRASTQQLMVLLTAVGCLLAATVSAKPPPLPADALRGFGWVALMVVAVMSSTVSLVALGLVAGMGGRFERLAVAVYGVTAAVILVGATSIVMQVIDDTTYYDVKADKVLLESSLASLWPLGACVAAAAFTGGAFRLAGYRWGRWPYA